MLHIYCAARRAYLEPLDCSPLESLKNVEKMS